MSWFSNRDSPESEITRLTSQENPARSSLEPSNNQSFADFYGEGNIWPKLIQVIL